MNLNERIKNLKTDIPAIFLALKDKKTPIFAKLLAALTVAYAFSPIDLIPDFIPVVGYFDDIIILPILIALTVKFIPSEVLERSRKQSQKFWQEGKHKKWYFAIPVLIIWILLILLILKFFFAKTKNK
ncbi:YkvA family protein [Treponema pectinovorum]|uniref:YkvA family protein n=1 Tax=Treponema pectinovorum TaxID=164 RepID=UPI0011F2F7EC|nr:DUF1232 domain-containing protein [Treponema pectinovorum]